MILHYNDSRGVNITGATIYAELGGNILDWDDIYGRTLDPIHRGKYRLKLNTTGLNDQTYFITGWIEKEGYDASLWQGRLGEIL